MGKNRSRLAMLGIAALSLCLAIGLASGAAEAKKKGKKKGVKEITVSKTTPTAIPANPTTSVQAQFVQVPFTVGKKAKGKVVAPDSIAVTLKVSGPVPAPDAGDLGHFDLSVTAPNGRQVFFNYPDDHNASVIGPVTVTANSSTFACAPGLTPPPPPCEDAEQTLGPPYAGTIGDPQLALFSGIGARGTWTFKVRNFADTAYSLDSVSIRIPLALKPATG
jgi:hypothetical protein